MGGMLDADSCYRAVRSRDARFDGRFFTGVLTTGIYCRPICSAKLPRRENVRFFECAAAAEEAGLRPCRRCRPETAIGSPAWLGTSGTVSRALTRIADGALDGDGVEPLASRLGIGSRQLRRLFATHLGASPRSLAQTRRIHFARQLVDETALPITEIALASGFSSVRRFNAAFLQTFRLAPRDVRKGAKRGTEPSPGTIDLRLPFRPPLDWPWLLGFLEGRAIEGVEEVEGGIYRRTVTVEGFRGVIEVKAAPDGKALVLRVPVAASRSLLSIVRRARRLFDLDCDPGEIRARLGRDATIGRVLERLPGIRVPGAWDGFEIAVRGILGQQVSVAGARTLAGRLVELYGERVPVERGPSRLFPRPEALASVRVARIGIPGSRWNAIRSLSREVARGAVDLDFGSSSDATRERLLRVPGIGPWTAQYIVMRALGDPDAFPAEDLGIRRALGRGGALAEVAAVQRRSERWRPWRAYAVMALWSRDHGRDVQRRTRNGSRTRSD
jgi:AraC family transcriptional regulator of adaptative response / DNA-3-methyladenine glycosylase II